MEENKKVHNTIQANIFLWMLTVLITIKEKVMYT